MGFHKLLLKKLFIRRFEGVTIRILRLFWIYWLNALLRLVVKLLKRIFACLIFIYIITLLLVLETYKKSVLLIRREFSSCD